MQSAPVDLQGRGAWGWPFAVVLAVVASIVGPAALANGSCPGVAGATLDDPLAQLQVDLVHLDRAAREAFAALPLEEFQIGARQATIGSDPAQLFAWVRDETHWLPYAGALRGARGVLMDRMGSSLDRALAMVALLESAGHTARLAYAPLDAADLERMSAHWSSQPLPLDDTDASPPDALADAIGETAARFGLDASELHDTYRNEAALAERTRERLRAQTLRQQQVLAAGLGTPDATGADGLPAYHWWAQVRTRAGWSDLDPALPRLRPGERLVGSAVEGTFFPDELPDRYRHRLTVEIVAEQWDAGRLREHVALAHTIAASELTTRQVRIETYPVNLPSIDAMFGNDAKFSVDALPDAVLGETEWMPLLRVGEQVVHDKSILSDGTVQERIGSTPQGTALRDATGLLGGIGVGRRGAQDAPDRPPELTAVHIRFTVEAPGRDSAVFVRPIVDVIGPAAREADLSRFEVTDAMRHRRNVGLLSTFDLAGQVAWVPWSQTTAQRYQGLVQQRLAGLGAVHALRADSLALMPSALEHASHRRDDLDRLLYLRRHVSPHHDAVALTRLNLLGYVRLVDLEQDGPTVREGFDLVDNRVDVPRVHADPRGVRLAQGIVDTLLEAELVAGEQPVANAARVFLQDLDADRPWRRITGNDDLDALGWLTDPDVRTHLASMLAAGYDVIVPTEGAAAVWWEVDPASGTILGYGPDRRGQAVEAILILLESMNNAANAVGMTQTVWACLLNSIDAPEMRCCIRNAAVMAAVNRYVSNGLSDYLELAGVVITGGNRLFDKLNSMAISQMAGKATSAFLGATAPSGQC